MTVAQFHSEAEAELLATARFYEEQADQLGIDFVAAVEATRDHLCEFPESGRPYGPRLRRFLIRRFPHALIYHWNGERILVVAVAHVRRRPGYWRTRS